MWGFTFFPALSTWTKTILDPVLLGFVGAPVLYFLVVLKLKRLITKLKENERLLRAAKEKAEEWAGALDVVEDPIFLHDRRFRILRCNKAYQLCAGIPFKEILGQPYYEIFPKAAAPLPSCLKALEKEEEEELSVGEASYRSRAFSVKDEQGVYLYSVHTLEDITERRNLEENLRQSLKMESVGRLAGGVAHDFNNMLGVILGHAELALTCLEPTQPLYADLEEIRKAANRSADLTRQLLTFARKQTISPKVVDLNKVMADIFKMLKRLIGDNIEFNWQPAAGLWVVKVDPAQIEQALTNLCVNARDAIADVGKITIEMGNSTINEADCGSQAAMVPGEYVRLAVIDNGSGIAKVMLGNIFEPFFTTKALGKGTGLGLAMVYGAAKQNNGFITVDSEPGKGATFTMYLPRHVGEVEQKRMEGAKGPISRGHETILLVEDNPGMRKTTALILEMQGYTVVAAATPGEGIRLAREHAGKIHLLMTDVIMPEMNGWDLAKELLSVYPSLKCMFISGHTADILARNGVLDEGIYFIQKPFSAKDLSVKIREALGDK